MSAPSQQPSLAPLPGQGMDEGHAGRRLEREDRDCCKHPSMLHDLYEEFTRLAGTRLAQN